MNAAAPRGFLGQPAGFSTLFFTELWERFSYYGMRAILLLFLVGEVTTGGMGLDDTTATAIYGLYTAGVYIMSMPGGWVADRLLGAQGAVLWGGSLIAIGHLHPRRRGIHGSSRAVPAGPRLHRAGHGPAEAQHQRAGGAAAREEQRRRARRRLHLVLHGHQHRRDGRARWPPAGCSSASAGTSASCRRPSAWARACGGSCARARCSATVGLPPPREPPPIARDWRILWIIVAVLVLLALLLFTGVLKVAATTLCSACHEGDAGGHRRVLRLPAVLRRTLGRRTHAASSCCWCW